MIHVPADPFMIFEALKIWPSLRRCSLSLNFAKKNIDFSTVDGLVISQQMDTLAPKYAGSVNTASLLTVLMLFNTGSHLFMRFS